jgi:hypothetical protein
LPKIYSKSWKSLLAIPASVLIFSSPLKLVAGLLDRRFPFGKTGTILGYDLPHLALPGEAVSLSAATHLAKALGGKYEANHLLGREPWDVSSLPVRK